MGNTLRVVGIILISMLLGLTSLVLLIFTICGGFVHAGETGAVLFAVGFVVLFGGGAAIVWLARGINPSRPQAGLAVAPVGHAPIAPASPMPVAPAPRRAPLAGSDLQLLVVLRVVIAVAILASLAIASTSFSMLRDGNTAVAVRIFAQAFIGVLPLALAFVLLLGNPPAGAALDLAVGTSIASVLWRMFSFSRYLLMAYGTASSIGVWMLQMAFFTLADLAIVVLALMVRRRVDTGHPGRLAAMILGFIAWEWLVQMVVMLAY